MSAPHRWRLRIPSRLRRPGATAKRLEAEGFERYDRADFTRGTRGEAGRCRREDRHRIPGERKLQRVRLAWQIRPARALFAYCESCAWDYMVERRAKRLALRRADAILDASTMPEARSHPADAAELDS